MKYKVGDKLRVITPMEARYDQVGVFVREDDDSWPVVVAFEGGDRDYFTYDMVQKVRADASKPNPARGRRAPKGPQAYKGNGNHKWELVAAGDDGTQPSSIYRLRVPGGWLYGKRIGSLTFVAMPEIVGYPT